MSARVPVESWLASPTSLDDACVHGDDGNRPFLWVGTHNITWLARAELADVAWFVSRRRFVRQRPRSWPQATALFALDSGAFSEMSLHQHWTFSAADYLDVIRQIQDRCGGDRFAWAAPMDACCEPSIVERVAARGLLAADLGRSQPRGVLDHLVWTVRNGLDLRARVRPGDPFIPYVVQGWTLDDYARCLELYDMAGVDLTREPFVAIGSTCRRDADLAILAKVALLGEAGIHRVHAFGLKNSALSVCAHRISSADSMAWSYHARRVGRPIIAGHEGRHQHCGNCPEAAVAWRDRTLSRADENIGRIRTGWAQLWAGIAAGEVA